MNERAKGLSSEVVVAMMALAAVAIARTLLPIEGPAQGDLKLFLHPWMEVIHQSGLASISGEFSEYTPPYIYLLNVAAWIEPWLNTTVAIKLINVPFVVACAWGIARIVREISGNRSLGMTASAVTLICPSLLINAFAFGQCDAIFTSFLIWFVYFAMRERPLLACLMFGMALSFKLQAMFLAPLLGTLCLWRRVRIWHLFLIPGAYLAMMIPAAIAGRPWTELLTIYVRQGNVMHDLSLNAPNPWWFLRILIDYRTGLIVGLLAGLAVAILLVWRSMKLPRTAIVILLLTTVSAAVMPWVLPKMTARYFFIADLMTIALAFARPRLWPAAVLVQIGSVLAILSDFFVPWGSAALGFGPMTLGVGILAYEVFREPQRAEIAQSEARG
jgi:Gpi18-like mannosyltransferase